MSCPYWCLNHQIASSSFTCISYQMWRKNPWMLSIMHVPRLTTPALWLLRLSLHWNRYRKISRFSLFICAPTIQWLQNLVQNLTSFHFYPFLPYFSSLYSSSETGSHYSQPASSPGTSTARLENQLSEAAPCQCSCVKCRTKNIILLNQSQSL